MNEKRNNTQLGRNDAGSKGVSISRDLLPGEVKMFEEMLSTRQGRPSTKSLKRLRCAIYARKSQADEKDVSLDAQISYCRDMIERSGLLELTAIFQEDDRSGMSTSKRTEFLRMFEQVCAHEIDVIVVYKWDRFARDRLDAGTYRNIAAQKGVYVLAGDQNVVVEDAASKLVLDILMDFNEYTARDSAEKTKNALVNEASKGYRMGGLAPFGYENAFRSLEVNLEEAALVSEAFDMALMGHSTAAIAKHLNKSGTRTHKGLLFCKQSVADMLRNPIYTGRYVYNRKNGKKKAVRVAIKQFPEVIKEDAFPRIVDEDTFSRVQEILDGKSSSAYVKKKHIYLLSGLLRCKSCGRLMVGSSHRGGRNGDKRYVYQCKGHDSGGPCPTKAINADYIERAVLEAAAPMVEQCLRETDLTAIIGSEVAVLNSHICRTEKAIKYTEKRIDTAFENLSSKNANIASLAEQRIENESAALTQLQEELKRYRAKKDGLQQAATAPATVTAEMLLEDRAAARTLLQLLFSSIEVDGDDITIVPR